jgi:hypothetical protein
MYEVAMNYPVDGLRRVYFDRKKGPSNIEDEDLLELGYSLEEIEQIKGEM